MQKNDLRWIKVGTSLYIPEVRSNGPIVTPLQVPASDVLAIVKRGINVYEVDPRTKKEIKLTITNIFDGDRFGKREIPVAPIPQEHQAKLTPEAPANVEVEVVVQPVVNLATEEVVELGELVDDEETDDEEPVDEQSAQNATEENIQNRNNRKNKKNRR